MNKTFKFLMFASIVVSLFVLSFRVKAKTPKKDSFEITVSFSIKIPKSWKKSFEKLNKQDKTELLGFIREYKKDFNPEKMLRLVEDDVCAVNKKIKSQKNSSRLKKFISHNLLPLRDNLSLSVRTFSGNKMVYEFLETLEVCFL
ncbi:hypothetical protein HN446_05070 [bacterium]|jgi:hypothetical protein|nr:hypothetical protein [bacterium]